MTNSEAIPFHDFKIAVTKRLGLDPEEATMLAWGDDGHVDVRFFLPVDEIWAILNGDKEEPLAEWEREFLARQEMTEELREIREQIATIQLDLNRTAREAGQKRRRSPGAQEHLFATYADGTLAYCSCGKTEDLKQHAREVLP